MRSGTRIVLNRLRRRLRKLPSQVLAVESDGLMVRAAIVGVRKGHDVVVGAYGESRALDFASALAEIVAGFREKQIALPRQAVLLAPQLLATVMPLPVDPRDPPSPEKMHEMVRWELEPYMAQHAITRPLGAILVGRGHVTENELARIVSEVSRRKTEGPENGTVSRFGEVAVQMSLVSRDHVDECLRLQGSFQEVDSEVACGWVGLSPTELEGQWHWLVCGMPRSLRSDFKRSFLTTGIRLEGIYPLVGCAVAALNGNVAGSCAVLEVQSGLLACTHLLDGTVTGNRYRYVTSHQDISQRCRDLVHEDHVQNIWFAGRAELSGPVIEEIGPALGVPCEPIAVHADDPSLSGDGAAAFAGIVGAVRHRLRLVPANRAVCVPVHDRKPAITRQPGFWYALTGCALVLGVILLELFLAGRRATLNEFQVAAAGVQSLRNEVKSAERSLGDLKARRDFQERVVLARDALLPILFRALQATVSNELRIESIVEDDEGVIHLAGWGLSEQACQTFRQEFSEALRSTRLKAMGGRVHQRRSSNGQLGYRLTFRMELSGAGKRKGRTQ